MQAHKMLIQFKNRHFYLMVASDAAIFVLSLFLAYLFRFDFTLVPKYQDQFLHLLPFVLPLKLSMFFLFGLYRGMWRYTDLLDFWRLFRASLISSLLLVTIVLYLYRFQGYPRSVFFIDGMLTFIFAGGFRVLVRTMYRYKDNLSLQAVFGFKSASRNWEKSLNVLIIGAGDAGEKILREVVENPTMSYKVLGFLDDDPEKKGRTVHGVPVLGKIEELKYYIERLNINQIFIAIPSATGKQMRRIVDECEKCFVSFKTLPSIGEIMDGKVSIKDLREVSFEDLLGREQVSLDSTEIQNYIQDKVVLVSGAGGSIGAELSRQIYHYGPKLIILLDASEPNLYSIQIEFEHKIRSKKYISILGHIQDKDFIKHIFTQYRPQIIFHAAAYKHVPILEQCPWEAVNNNILGSKVLMQTAQRHGAEKFVIISTDKAVNPSNVMGVSKRITEVMMQSFNTDGYTKFMAVRFGNVVGSSGSVIPLFKKQIEHGGPVSVTHPEVTRFFMTISEAVQLVLQAGSVGEGGEIFILDMGTPVKIVDVAKDLIRLMGKEPERDIEIAFTGLRAGEKLYEELFGDKDQIVNTKHPKILMVKENNISKENQHRNRILFNQQLKELFQVTEEMNPEKIKKKLQEIVPEYNARE